MVYIGNIITVHELLADDEEIQLIYGGDNITRIWKDDQLEKCRGDLKITRDNPKCTLIVDCAEVKYLIVTKRWL